MVKKIRTQSRDKSKIKIGFVISRLAKYINNTTSISLLEMGLKKDFVHAREQSTSDLCVFIFLNPVFLICGFLITYNCIMYRMGGPYLYYKCIILHDQTL
jgi:hypothetical protein